MQQTILEYGQAAEIGILEETGLGRQQTALTDRSRVIPKSAATQPEINTVRVALAGCGVVGSALVRLLHASADRIAGRHSARIEITRVLVRDTDRDRGLPLPGSIFTSDVAAFLSEDADVVIEAIGGEQPARDIASATLAKGRKFVTANKQLIAAFGDELGILADFTGGSLDFGAAVGGSAPVISVLKEFLGGATPFAVRGILNGTSNHVLTSLERGHGFSAALAAARSAGLAEADCTRDLDGCDAADKLAIIAWVAYGISPRDLRIRRRSLLPDPARLVRRAKSFGGKLRIISECVALPNRAITAAVEPVIVPEDSAFGRTVLEDNRLEADLGWTAPVCVSGPGAGGAPTAAALLGDLFRSSAVANARSVRATSFQSVDDPRPHRWLVSAYANARNLQRECEIAGVAIETIEGSGHDVWVTTAPERWPALSALLDGLELRYLRPVAARIELSSAEAL